MTEIYETQFHSKTNLYSAKAQDAILAEALESLSLLSGGNSITTADHINFQTTVLSSKCTYSKIL
jgi:hypothetical protein